MKNEYMPAPWRVRPWDNSTTTRIAEIVAANGETFAEAFSLSSKEEMRVAHIMASAPDMLEALQRLHGMYSDHSRTSFDLVEIRGILKAVIDKATLDKHTPTEAFL